MSLEDIVQKISGKLQYTPFRHTALFDFGDDGSVFLDGTQLPPTVTEGSGDAEVTLEASVETFRKILDGSQDPNFAFLTGKLKVRGSMGLALKLNSLLE